MRFNKKILQITCVVLLIVPIISVTTIQAKLVEYNEMPFTTEDTDIFIDDFLTNTFRDPASDVWGWGTGTLTNERNINITQLDFLETDNPIMDLVVDGKKAYAVGFNMTTYTNTVLAFDIYDPQNINLMSSRDSLSGMIACANDGDVFYGGVMDSDYASNSLAFYNISRPYNLGAITGVYEGSIFTDGAITDIAVQGHLVYYTSFNDTSDNGLRIADAFDPDNPVEHLNNWNTKKALGLEVNRHIAYIAASDEGLYTLNVSDKHNIVELDFLDLPGNATDVILDGSIAYVTLGPAGIVAVDVHDPTNINVIDIYDNVGITRHMALQGNTLYVTSSTMGVLVFDVADPSHMSRLPSIPVPDAWDIELFGEVVVVGAEQGIYTYEVAAEGGGITDFSNTVSASIDTGFQVWDIEVFGDIAYIVGGPDGLYTMNVRNPLNPILLDRWSDSGSGFTELSLSGQFVHCSNASGEYVFDTSNPNNIKFLQFVAGSGMTDIINVGGISYVTLGTTLGVGNLTHPAGIFSLLDTAIIGSNISAVCVKGRYIYVGDYIGASGDTLFIFEIFDPNNIQLIYTKSGLFGYHNEFVVEGDILYSANGRWLHLWNTSDLDNFLMLDFVNWGAGNHTTKDVQPFGNYLVVANSFIGIHLFDTYIPSDIQLLSTYEANNASKISMSGDYTFVANIDSLKVIRHFESIGDTYFDVTNTAQSTSIFTMPNGSITAATLNIDAWVPIPTSLQFEMTADGVNWEPVTPGILHNFTNVGTDLRWRATFNGETFRSSHLYLIEIIFDFEYDRPFFDITDPLWIAIIAGGGGGLLLLIIIIVIVAVSRKKKKAAAPTR